MDEKQRTKRNVFCFLYKYENVYKIGVDEMASLLKSTKNTRAILPDSLKYIRSDVLDCITQEEIDWLEKNNIVTIIDLRGEKERKQKPCPLERNSKFIYYCMPVTGGNAIPESVDMVSKSYIHMVDCQMDKIIERIMNATTNVLYFCNAGKDRTGVVSAILLHKLGMSREYIVDDYMQSLGNLKDMLSSYKEKFPKVNVEVITPKKRYMEEFIEEMLQKYV